MKTDIMNRPLVGVTIGDPAGIGPEIVIKALKNQDLYSIARPVVVGSLSILEKVERIVRSGLRFNVLKDTSEGLYEKGTIDLIDISSRDDDSIIFGRVQGAAGKASYNYLSETANLAMKSKIDVIATAPINKESIKAAGIALIGHTEMLAELSGTDDPLTMFQVGNLRIFFLTRHVSLMEACRMVKRDRIARYLVKCSEAMERLGLKNGTIAVAGLNPHNGEHGLFGDDEVREIEPAVNDARKNGVNAVGPVPADSVFHLAKSGRYDAVLSLYHDQGHIAAKTLDFERTISLTIGMPFLRTSVDHGTAFDIAGKGIAGSISMEEAIRLAAVYGLNYRR